MSSIKISLMRNYKFTLPLEGGFTQHFSIRLTNVSVHLISRQLLQFDDALLGLDFINPTILKAWSLRVRIIIHTGYLLLSEISRYASRREQNANYSTGRA